MVCPCPSKVPVYLFELLPIGVQSAKLSPFVTLPSWSNAKEVSRPLFIVISAVRTAFAEVFCTVLSVSVPFTSPANQYSSSGVAI